MTEVGCLFRREDGRKHSSFVNQDCQNEMLHGHKIILKYSGHFLGDKGHKHDMLRRGSLELTPASGRAPTKPD